MPRTNRINFLLAYLPISCVLTCVFLAHTWTQHRNRSAMTMPHGRYSMQQIRSLSEPLCYALAPEATGLQITYTSLLAFDRTGQKARHRWLVEYRDGSGQYQGVLLWDADMGLVEKISQHQPAPSQPSDSLNRVDAIEAASRWLITMNMVNVATDKKWRLASPPKYVNGQWHCRFISPHARVYAALSAANGQLLFAQTQPL